MKEFNIQDGAGELIIHIPGDNSIYEITYDHGQMIFQTTERKYIIPESVGDRINFKYPDPNTGKVKYVIDTIRTLYRDTTPTDFGLTDVTNATKGSSHFTEEIVVGGINESIAVSAPAGVNIYVNGIPVASGALVEEGDVVKFEVYAANSFETTSTFNLSVGDITKSFYVTTEIGVRANCKAWKAEGYNTSGVYKVNPYGTIVDAYCDMTTSGGGWTLVGSWDDAAEWTKTSTSTDTAFTTTAKNAFSSNFGDTLMNEFRVLVSNAVSTTGSSSYADFYYHWDTATTWKEVWSSAAGNRSAYQSPTPRQALKQFNSAYNIRYNTAVNQIWANNSDWRPSVADAYGYVADWWAGLTTPGVQLGIYSLSTYADGSATADGTFGLSSSIVAGTDYSGQDTNFNVKIGYDDQQKFIRIGGGNSTNNYTQQESGVDVNSKLWIWIR